MLSYVAEKKHMLLKGNGQKSGVDKVLTLDKYELAVAGTTPEERKLKKLGS